ncbi:hypothetical protein [Wolbachia endosymbiont (group A) of Agelastica alni]|uniref:hypothetical protein n=1 Tax=Wolbachia endosymbiont (group A) of Agelastica alni TaxID=3066130 RepID=UPI003132AFF3
MQQGHSLLMAVNKRKPDKNLLLHSNQGSQYTSQNYQFLLNTKNIISSMSHKGCCYDNSVAEKFTQKGAAYSRSTNQNCHI